MSSPSVIPILLVFFLLLGVSLPLTSGESADFVIVGAGTAGCVVAARLCSNLPTAKVILLERSAPRTPELEFLVRSPRAFLDTWSNLDLVQVYPSLPDESLNNRTSFIVTGATIGGSSAINGMQWTHPLGDTLKRWNILGLSARVAEIFYRKAYKEVGFAPQPRSLRQKYAPDYIKAAVRAGFRNNFMPFSSKVRNDVWDIAHAITNTGRRIDSCTAYLDPVKNTVCASNLVLKQDATVTRILLNKDKKSKATGVEYVRSSSGNVKKKKTIDVRREVIVSAGPFESPKLLQLSGIGNAKHLRRVGIKPRVELPVGAKTQIRPFGVFEGRYTGVELEPSNNSTLLNSRRERRRFEAGKRSVLGTSGLPVHATARANGYITVVTGFGTLDHDKPLVQSVCIINPTAFGFLKIKSPNPFETPDVKLNLLGKQKDLKRLRRCLLRLRDIHNEFPESFELTTTTPAEFTTEEWLRDNAQSAFHFVGGCSVGKVLSGNLKVKGVRGLRVIDASAFNSMPTSAGPLASTYMLAEYASEKISHAWRCELEGTQRRNGAACDNGW